MKPRAEMTQIESRTISLKVTACARSRPSLSPDRVLEKILESQNYCTKRVIG